MNNAKYMVSDILYRPTDPKFDERIRQFQGCPTLAITKGGRIYLGWYAGGTREPHPDNYNLLIYSDDEGKNWSKPLLVIPSSREKRIHALDIQLFTDPRGALHVYWVQNNIKPAPEVMPKAKPGQPIVAVDGYLFDDFDHAEWEMVCESPDDETPVFSAPRYLDKGFLRCKPLILRNGTWLNFNYDQTSEGYGYSLSTDGGKSFTRRYGAKKLATMFDEAMAYQRFDGSIRMLARTTLGELAESISLDNGMTWSEAALSGIDSPNTRFYIARTPSGRVLLINNDHRSSRTNMTLYLSEDDGVTWKYKRTFDTRGSLSYPDADFFGDQIYLTYDRERTGEKEILFLSLTESDIMDESRPLVPTVVSKP